VNVSCPDCRSVFRIDPAKVPTAGIRARCAICGAVFDVEPARSTQPPQQRAGAPTPHVAIDAATATSVAETSSAGATPPVEEHGEDVTPASATTGVSGPPAAGAASLGEERALHAPPAAATEPMFVAEPEPQTVPEPRPRPVNPYLNNTPELRARRLARALVSDLVAYNPQKREQGLRDGTLRQLFRDEIRKSWDEYVEQVGASVAESTPHFQDALNDVLAGGRRVF